MTAAPKCPMCSSMMHRLYEQMTDPITRKRMFVGIGHRCANPACRYIMQDGV